MNNNPFMVVNIVLCCAVEPVPQVRTDPGKVWEVL